MQNPMKRAKETIEKHGDFIRSVIRFHNRNEAEAEDVFKDFYMFLVAKPIPEEVQDEKGFLYKIISDMIKYADRRNVSYNTLIRRYAERNLNIGEISTDKFPFS